MKRILLLSLVLSSLCRAASPSASFIARLVAVESGGRANAVGDGGRAVGILQIHAGLVADVNRIAGRHFTLADRLDPQKSAEMCRIYLSHYATKARLGHEPTMQDMARIWNGGPAGWRKGATLGYWQRVK